MVSGEAADVYTAGGIRTIRDRQVGRDKNAKNRVYSKQFHLIEVEVSPISTGENIVYEGAVVGIQ